MKKMIGIICLVFCSCKITTTKNIELNFVEESKTSLEKYLLENKVDYQDHHLYTLKDIQSFADYNDQDQLNLPEILFYNNKGEQVENNFNKRKCSNILEDYKQINDLEVATNAPPINAKMKQLKPLLVGQFEEDKITVIIFYAKFVGAHKTINQQSFEWYDIVSQSAEEEINILLVSLDVMEDWNITEPTKKSLGME